MIDDLKILRDEISDYLAMHVKLDMPSHEQELLINQAKLIKLSPLFSENFDHEKFQKLMQSSDNLLKEALIKISIQWLNQDKKPVPFIVRDFIIEKLKIYKLPNQKKKYRNFDKRMALAVAAYKFSKAGYSLGRNDESDSELNAFCLTVNAAKEAGYKGVTYNTVKDAYYAVSKYLNH